MDHIQLLCDISELNHLFRDSVSVENFLDRIVNMVTEHMKADVCSIYLYDEDSEELVMKATKGLHPDSVEHIRMQIGTGLVGQALKELKPISVTKASKQENFKPFVGSGEEDFENFLAVPITRGVSRIGVLVVQRARRKRFYQADIMAIKAVASQLANIIENARFVMTMNHTTERRSRPRLSKGIKFLRCKAASQGFAFASAAVVDKNQTFAGLMKKKTYNDYTLEDFNDALKKTSDQLEELQNQVEEKLSDAASLIFASHLLILKDKQFVGAMREQIEKGQNPPQAILQIAHQFIDMFSISGSSYIAEKVQDVEDIVIRLMANLENETDVLINYENRIVIARELFPSDLLRMSSERVQGVVLVSGGVTSHLSILARSLDIPMVIANKVELMSVEDRTPLLIDADQGNLYIDPDLEVQENFANKNKAAEKAKKQKAKVKPETFTADGTRITLLSNINLLGDGDTANEFKSEGVGLYRTEFPFIIRSDFPSEEEQFVTYTKLFAKMQGKPVTFRTLDIGGDKILSYYHNAKEQNPAMGMRSIRFLLENKGIFTKQIRAILRAGLGADLRIMFPMISSVDEFIEAKQLVSNCSDMLKHEQVEHNDSPQIGMMVELPCVIEIIDALAKESDFFSIGTNDLIQFMLGVDRTNENVESFYIAHHPAVLRSIAKVAAAALRHDKGVSVCGDVGHSKHFLTFLLGIGITTLSIESMFVPKIQKFISTIDINEAHKLAQNVLAQTNIKKIASMMGVKQDI